MTEVISPDNVLRLCICSNEPFRVLAYTILMFHNIIESRLALSTCESEQAHLGLTDRQHHSIWPQKEQGQWISNSSVAFILLLAMHEFSLAKCEWCPLLRSYSISSTKSVQRLNGAFPAMRHRHYLDVFSELLGHASGGEWRWVSSDDVNNFSVVNTVPTFSTIKWRSLAMTSLPLLYLAYAVHLCASCVFVVPLRSIHCGVVGANVIIWSYTIIVNK